MAFGELRQSTCFTDSLGSLGTGTQSTSIAAPALTLNSLGKAWDHQGRDGEGGGVYLDVRGQRDVAGDDVLHGEVGAYLDSLLKMRSVK